MSDKITSNIKLAKKIKKLGTRQEIVLPGVPEFLTEEEETNINLTLIKMDQFSNNIKVEEDKPSNQHTAEKKQVLRLLSHHSNTSFVHLRIQTKWTV